MRIAESSAASARTASEPGRCPRPEQARASTQPSSAGSSRARCRRRFRSARGGATSCSRACTRLRTCLPAGARRLRRSGCCRRQPGSRPSHTRAACRRSATRARRSRRRAARACPRASGASQRVRPASSRAIPAGLSSLPARPGRHPRRSNVALRRSSRRLPGSALPWSRRRWRQPIRRRRNSDAWKRWCSRLPPSQDPRVARQALRDRHGNHGHHYDEKDDDVHLGELLAEPQISRGSRSAGCSARLP